MPRSLRRFLLIAFLLAAWALVGSDRAPVPVTFAEASAGQVSYTDADQASTAEKLHDLSQLKLFNRVVLYVKENYVDPKRIHPKEMMLSALEYVEKTVPEVMVEGTAESGKLTVNVNGKIKDFDIHDVDSLWRMSYRMKDVFDFMAQNMRPVDDTRDIEYAAVNGMLSTLDPHSVLLKPDLYREMKLATRGEFGGLGFVIQMKEGNLTVVKVLPRTPAARAGIKKDDQIRKIGEESTVNMDLTEAVSKLRGPVDSKVTITIVRKGADRPLVMTLARAMISIESVQSKLLAGNVGYVRLKNFQGNTTRDLQAALTDLTQKAGADGLKGLVLDLRGNPGGLLDQAIQVSDMFLSQGTIVATVGYSDKMREEKHAHPDDTDNLWPIAVLVNPGSASASEIVAGALKNLNRAVIIGQQTFGKGSVQVLYEIPEHNPNDESALKLTIAKYLTPGDVSIQEVGIEPDIELVPTRVTPERINVFAPRKTIGEADLDNHFGNPNSHSVAKTREDVLGREKPLEEVKYLKEDSQLKDASARMQKQQETKSSRLSAKDKGMKGKKGGEDNKILTDTPDQNLDEDLYDQLDAETQDEVKEDFEVLFARDYVLHAPSTDRLKMLQEAKGFVAEKRLEEEDRIDHALEQLGLDWSPGPTPKNSPLAVSVRPTADKRILAGDQLELEVTAENKGSEPLHRLRAWTESDNPLLDRREFAFGLLKPGESRSWKVPVRMPKDLTSRRDEISVKFFDDQGALPETAVADLNFAELPRPAFALNWQVLDTCAACNGDGEVSRGEEIQLLVDVTNRGPGKALDAFAQIKNGADQNIFIEKGRYHLGELAPGETKTARFTLEVKRGYVGQSFRLRLDAVDEPLEEFASEKVLIPVQDSPREVTARHATVRLGDGATLLSAPEPQASALLKLPRGGLLAEVGRVNGYDKVEVEKDRFAFVASSGARELRSGRPQPLREVQYEPARIPPEIAVNVDPAQGGIVSSSDKVTLAGTVTDPLGLLDMYVLVNDQKVFFKTADAVHGTVQKFKFTADCPLKEGNNFVIVVARETPEFSSRKTLVIRRQPSAVAQLANPPGAVSGAETH